jgi:hypothetical protein
LQQGGQWESSQKKGSNHCSRGWCMLSCLNDSFVNS